MQREGAVGYAVAVDVSCDQKLILLMLMPTNTMSDKLESSQGWEKEQFRVDR